MKTTPMRRGFWLANLALLLIYVWTLTEESAFTIEVTTDRCTAVFPERSSDISCSGLSGGYVGVYLDKRTGAGWTDFGLLDWLAPRSAWRDIRVTRSGVEPRKIVLNPERPLQGWRSVGSEWRPVWDGATLRWPTPFSPPFTLEATLRRPEEIAGILLLEPNGEDGWAFITTPEGRRGVWWRWRDGEPQAPIVGVPFQRSALAQAQSLLGRILRAHHGALLLLGLAWLTATAWTQWPRFAKRRWPSPRFPLLLRSAFSSKWAVLWPTLGVFLVALFVADDVLERMPHVQDSITYLFQAKTLAKGYLWSPAPSLPEFFEQEFLLARDGRWFGKYTPGYPLVLALGVGLDLPWIVNPLLATLTVPLIYALGKRLYGRSEGRVAALLALASPFFLIMSGNMMAHAAELFWTTLFMLGWLRALEQKPHGRWLWLAGVSLGMVFLTRNFTAVGIGLPFVLITTTGYIGSQKRGSWAIAARRISQLLAILLIFVLLLLAYQWAVTGDPFEDPRLLYWEYDRLGFGPDKGQAYNAFTLTREGEDVVVNWFYDPDQPPNGHSLARGLYNSEENWRSLERELFGWPAVFTLAFCWLAFLTRRPDWRDLALLAAALGLMSSYVFYWASGIMYGPRYYYAALPALFLLTSRGIRAAGDWMGNEAGRWAIRALLVVLILGNVFYYLPLLLEATRGYNFISGDSLASVTTSVGEKALVFVTSENGDWWEYGSFFSANSPWLDNPVLFARDLGEERNGRLMALYPQFPAFLLREGKLVKLYP